MYQHVKNQFTSGFNPEGMAIKKVSYWQGVALLKKPFSSEALQAYLNSDSADGYNVITQDGELFNTNMTPGYCDGMGTVSADYLKTLLTTF